MKIPEPMHSIENIIYRAYEIEQEKPRLHMGASLLGHHCERWLWLSFRHAVVEQFNGRMLLLFKRGHEEEERVVGHLRKIGVIVENVGSDQMRFSFGAHVAGSADGLLSNLPFAPNSLAILEVKTHSEKSFNDLKAKGVKVSKPMHWTQCCVYGFGAGVGRALYFAINKNTDEIYTEWLHLDLDVAQKAIARGQRIALADRIPPPISTDPTWYQCGWCPAKAMCHKSQPTKEVNCRTCAHATPKDDSTWHCARWDMTIPPEAQYDGCNDHVFHPDMVPWQMEGSDDGLSVTWLIGQSRLRNGAGGLTSRQLLDETVQALAGAFNAS